MEWISVDDQLPEEGQTVDIWLKELKKREPNVDFNNGLWLQEGRIFKDIGVQYIFVSHWMPIPESPFKLT